MSDRKVKRVLVMLDYGPGESDSGEVFDLTALVDEMRNDGWSANIDLSVSSKRNYSAKDGEPKNELTIKWGGYAGQFVYGATHLDDVINSAMPDSFTVQNLREKASRTKKRAEDRVRALEHDAMAAKLQQVAGIRHQFPIARVAESHLLAVATQTLTTP